MVVAAECREAVSVVDDLKMCIAELEQENQIPTISVEAIDGEVARVFMGSPRSEVQFVLNDAKGKFSFKKIRIYGNDFSLLVLESNVST